MVAYTIPYSFVRRSRLKWWTDFPHKLEHDGYFQNIISVCNSNLDWEQKDGFVANINTYSLRRGWGGGGSEHTPIPDRLTCHPIGESNLDVLVAGHNASEKKPRGHHVYSMLYQEYIFIVIIHFDRTASFTTIVMCSFLDNTTDRGKGNYQECRYIGHFYQCFQIEFASTSCNLYKLSISSHKQELEQKQRTSTDGISQWSWEMIALKR